MTIKNDISARIQEFTAELEVLVRRAALEAVAAALGGGTTTAPPAELARPRRRRRTRLAAKIAPVATPPSARANVSLKRKKGGKRSAAQLAQIDAAVVAHVKANAGKGIEDMAKALGVATNDLKLRVALLVVGKKLKKTGVKRATKYFAA